jgi:threonine aldolase
VAEAGPAEPPDAYGEGPVVAALESEVARLLGKPAAVLLPSGTMAQQIACRIHAEERGVRTVAWHPTCHLQLHEQDGAQLLHGLRAQRVGDPRTLITRADLDALAGRLAVLLLELPQREIGGQLPRWEELATHVAWARERGVALHLDGARLWECAPFYGRTHAEIAALFDTVYVSFYKTLGGIAGAALAGPVDFVAQARVWRKRQGGSLVAMWPLAISARLALRERLPLVAGYVERARSLARALAAVDGVAVKPDPPHVNMMHVYLRRDADAVAVAAAALMHRTRVALFRRLRPAEVPGWCSFEVAIGDAAANISNDEVAALARELLG